MKVLNFLKTNWYFFLIILFLIITNGLVLSYHFWFSYNETEEIMPDIAINDEVEENILSVPIETEKIKVDIKGYINKPGVYELEKGSIVNDLIKLAGGLKSNASTKNINLSKKLQDEMVIVIYSKTEVSKLMETDNTLDNTSCNCEDVVITDCVKDNASIIEENPNKDEQENNSSNNSKENVTQKISLNNATKTELMTIPGIGEAKAQKIIEYREKKPFISIEEIKNISGIGDKIFEEIKDFITI